MKVGEEMLPLGREERVLEGEQWGLEGSLKERCQGPQATDKAWAKGRFHLGCWDLRPEESGASVSRWRPRKLAKTHRGNGCSKQGQVGTQIAWHEWPWLRHGTETTKSHLTESDSRGQCICGDQWPKPREGKRCLTVTMVTKNQMLSMSYFPLSFWSYLSPPEM